MLTPQFEYFRHHDVAQLTSPRYVGEMLFSDSFDQLPTTRGLPHCSSGADVHVRMWEAPDSCRRVWGDLFHRPQCLGAARAATLLDTVRFVTKEAACEAHVTLAKLTNRIARRTPSRPGSAARSTQS